MTLTKVTNSMISGAWVNVLDYGADPLGSADSTQAFQNAITALDSATGSTAVLYIPAGSYKLTDEIILPTYDQQVTVFAYGATLNFSTAPAGKNGFITNGNSNNYAGKFCWFGGRIYGSTDQNNGLYINGSGGRQYQYSACVRDLVIQGFGGTGLYIEGGTYGVYDNLILSLNYNGIVITQDTGGASDSNNITNCFVTDSTNVGILLEVGAGNTISKCKIIANQVGIKVQPRPSNGFIDNLKIDGCYFENNGLNSGDAFLHVGQAFSYANTNAMIISNNIFLGGQDVTFAQVSDCKNLQFSDNWIYATATVNFGSTVIDPVVFGNYWQSGATFINTASFSSTQPDSVSVAKQLFTTFATFTPIALPVAGTSEGEVVYDSGTHKLYCWNGTTWNALY